MARKKGSTDYPSETKLEAIRLWEEEGLPYKEVTARLEIRDPKQVRNWMRIYRQEGLAGLKKPRRGRPKKDRDGLEERVKQLEMFKSIGHRARGRIARGSIQGVILQSYQWPQLQSAVYRTLTSELGIIPPM